MSLDLHILRSMLTVALISLIVYMIRKANQKTIRPTADGVLTYAASGLFTGIGGVLTLLFVGFYAFLWYLAAQAGYDEASVYVLKFFGVLIGLFLLVSLYLLLFGLRAKVHVTEAGVTAVNFLGQSTTIAWSDVSRVYYRRIAKYLVLVDQQGRKALMSESLTGFDQLAEFTLKRVDPRYHHPSVRVLQGR